MKILFISITRNFDLLEHEFEDYEVICASNSFWVIEFKGRVEKYHRKNFQNRLSVDYNVIKTNLKLRYYDIEKIRVMTDKLISNYLLHDICKTIDKIDLILKKEEYE